MRYGNQIYPSRLPIPLVAEHCDRCGTELDPEQRRHQQYRVDHPANPEDTLEGCLCSDCFWGFKEWLETE